jgi:hypothetical protein
VAKSPASSSGGSGDFWGRVAEQMEKLNDPVKDYIKQKQDEEKAVEKAREANKKYLDGLSFGLSKVTSIVTAAQSSIISFGNSLASFVGKANPVAVMQFTRAVENLQAVIGRALTPALETVTGMVRQLGDAFASLSPTAQRLVGALSFGGGLAGVFGAVSLAVKGLMATFGPVPLIVGAVAGALAGIVATSASGQRIMAAFQSVLTAVGTVFEALAGVVLPVVETALDLIVPLLNEFATGIRFVGSAIKDVLNFIGLTDAANYNPKAQSADGAAVRGAGMSSLSSFASKNYASAFSGSAGQDIPKESLGRLTDIDNGLTTMREMIREFFRDVLNVLRPEKGTAADAALNPFERGGDGRTNFGRGLDRLMDRMVSVLD